MQNQSTIKNKMLKIKLGTVKLLENFFLLHNSLFKQQFEYTLINMLYLDHNHI